MSGMRDYLLLMVLGGLVPVSLFRPWVGVLGWFWIAYLVPHSLTWGFGRNLPLAALVGGATLVGFLFTRERKPLPRTWGVFFLLLFSVHITLSTVMSYNGELAWLKWEWVVKVMLMTVVTLTLFQERERLRYLYMIPALCLGLHGLKSGLWVLRTGGNYRAWGPERSFFADNNTYGLALAIALPLLLYLSRDEPRRWLRQVMRAMFVFSAITILFTYSRGAFLGLCVVLGVLVWRSPWRWRFGVVMVVVVFLAVPFLPAQLKDRIASIADQETAETRDTSAAGRLEAWQTAARIAVAHPFFGEGFKALWSTELWNTYYGTNYLAVRDVHSLYLEVLSEHGILGFVIYLLILISTLNTLRRVRKRWRGDPEHGYLSRYAEMTQLALYPYLVAGAFLGVAYFDLYFLLVGSSALLEVLSLRAATAVKEVESRPAAAASSRLPASPRWLNRRAEHA